MFCESEIELLSDTLKKMRIQSRFTDSTSGVEALLDEIHEDIRNSTQALRISRNCDLPYQLKPLTVYKLTDSFEFNYVFFTTAKAEKENVLFIGPYLSERPSESKLLLLCEQNSVPPARQRGMREYYMNVGVIDDKNSMPLVIDTLCERMWQTATFHVVDVNEKYKAPASPINTELTEADFDDILADMKAMEKRYEQENALIRAVTLGQTHKENLFNPGFNDEKFEKRIPDLLRNSKNYCIIMNTLLRKAAEAGGVHPLYIDKVSSAFAEKIERIAYLSEVSALMKELFKEYSKLVRNHTMKNYSEIVRTAILLIDSDISAQLSPSNLASAQNVSLGYLSTIFRKETGVTLTDYIKEKRIEHAKHLLTTTELQIQSVAMHCGIVDLQYFSKIFKKHTGKTPKQFRSEFQN